MSRTILITGLLPAIYPTCLASVQATSSGCAGTGHQIVKEFEAAAVVASCLSGMRSPWRWMEQFHLLGHQQGAKFRGEALYEILV